MIESNANRLIVASCTPKTHEPVFQSVLESMGVDPSFLEFVNIREHASFVHRQDKPGAQKVAEDAIRSAVARAAVLEKILVKEVDITKKSLIIGGGVAGLSAAIELGLMEVKCIICDDKHELGGKLSLQTHNFFGSIRDCFAGYRGMDIGYNKNPFVKKGE